MDFFSEIPSKNLRKSAKKNCVKNGIFTKYVRINIGVTISFNVTHF